MLEIQIGPYPQVFLLILARVAAVLGVLQFLGGVRMMPTFRVAMALMVSIGILPAISVPWIELAGHLTNVTEWSLALLQEVLLGASLGLACQLIISATSVAGFLIGMGTSLMMARSMDPSSGRDMAIPQQIFMMLFTLFLLLTNAHLELVRLLAESFRRLPVLSGWNGENVIGMMLSAGDQMFEWGLRLAMPVFCTALVMDACLGLMARLAPDFDILFLSLPIRLFAGLAVIGITIRVSAGVFTPMREKMFWIFGRLLAA